MSWGELYIILTTVALWKKSNELGKSPTHMQANAMLKTPMM